MVASSLAVLRTSRLCQWGWKCRARLPRPQPIGPGGWTAWTPARTNATLSLEPAGRSCWDEPLSIAVHGLAPEQPVTLRAALRDEKGARFRAHARYRADAHGRLDLARAPALGGSFAGLEPMGLLWALEPERPLWRLIKRDVQTPFVVELEVLDGHEPDGGRLLARAVHERHFMAPGVRRVPVREGRVRATLFLPPEPGPYPGIVDLFGVGGGLLEYRASLLAGKGFAVMALAYYNYDDLPKGMETMRIEYFEEAVNYLLSHPEVKGPGVGLLGISKGGELGLAMASFLKGIKAAVIINGSVAAVGNTIYYKDETIPPVSLLRNRVRMTTTGRASSMPMRSPNACRPMGRRSPRSSATRKRGIILSPLISPCARRACTSWWGLTSPLEGSLSLMPWPSWMHGSNSRLSSTNTWVVRVRGDSQNITHYLLVLEKTSNILSEY
ncbi:acyl-coenzyme A thioesterase 2, mitochondrial-like isoform X2 [Peromyscus maniculatus bairdii]|uniref:acyl-coenzyme A thioesterase 2, mitochondrial-like isoform X2 n=1 Tax=Peromyscus maniculatus bairdii TaxID=230844 RepID=UPI003FD2EDCD